MASTMQPPTMPGSRVRKTTETEILPPRGSSPDDAKASPFYAQDWEIVVNSMTPAEWANHILRVYRSDEKWERGAGPVDNTFSAPFTEEDLRSRFGGGRYVLWLYGPPKKQTLVGRYRVELEGAPIIKSHPANGAAQPNGTDAVAIEAMRMYANPEFVRMQMQMMVTAATEAMALIKSQMPAAQDPLATLRNAKEILGIGVAPASNPLDELTRTLLTAAIQKLVNPPESNSLKDTIALVNDIKASGLFGGSPKADLTSTFVSNLPMLVDRAVQGLHEFRLQTEAQLRLNQQHDPRVITVEQPLRDAASPPPAAPAAPPPPQAPRTITPEEAQAIIAQSHLHRLVNGIRQPNSTGQDMYDYLVNAWPEVLDELVKFDKDTLLAFFKNSEAQKQYFGSDVLTQVASDPRLPKMIEDFLSIAKKVAAAESVAPTAVV